MSDLFGNHIVGFPTRWLICQLNVTAFITLDQKGLICYINIFYIYQLRIDAIDNFLHQFLSLVNCECVFHT